MSIYDLLWPVLPAVGLVASLAPLLPLALGTYLLWWIGAKALFWSMDRLHRYVVAWLVLPAFVVYAIAAPVALGAAALGWLEARLDAGGVYLALLVAGVVLFLGALVAEAVWMRVRRRRLRRSWGERHDP